MTSRRRRLCIVLATLFLLCVGAFFGRLRHGSRNADSVQADSVQQGASGKEIARQLRHRRVMAFEGGFDPLISGLTWSRNWPQRLQLNQVQIKVLKDFDVVLQEAGDQVAELVADRIEHDPPDCTPEIKRFWAKFRQAEVHAERLVALGLLSEQQAKVVKRVDPVYACLQLAQVPELQERLRLSENQKRELEKIERSGDRANERAIQVLTESQRRIWDQATAEPPKPEKPDFHALTAAEAAKVNLEAASPVFRALAERPNSFGLSDLQKGLLRKLDPIIREGLYWISLRTPRGAMPTADVSRTSADFVREAEQVVLLGFLTDEQAKQVESATKWTR